MSGQLPGAFDPAALLHSLVAAEVDFVVVGTVAAVLQGAPVLTTDLDVSPRQDIENAERIVDALARLGAVHAQGGRPDERDFLGWRPNTYLTSAGRLDVVPEASGIGGYVELLPRAVRVLLNNDDVLLASLQDVISSKELLSRPKDLAGLPALYAAREALRRHN